MSGALEAGTKNTVLDYLGTLMPYVSAHTGDPGATGANESSGSRVAVTWSASTSAVLPSSSLSITIPAGTFTWLGFWSASTGGIYRGKMQLPAPVTGAGSIPLSSLAWDLALTPSA